MDDTARVDTYVIADPSSVQVSNLLSVLETDTRLNVLRLDAIMLNPHSEDYLALKQTSERHFKARYGRMIMPGEVGCSLSHNLARSLASQNKLGALVLEEDAQVMNLENFVATTLKFLEKNLNDSKVLSFYNNEYMGHTACGTNLIESWTSIFGSPSSTVAYALTPKAAQKLLRANVPLKYLADWPTTDIDYFISLSQDIGHPINAHLSQIGNRRLRTNGFKVIEKFQIVTGIYFLLNRQTFSSFNEFYNDLLLPRINNRLNRIFLPKFTKRKYAEL